MEPKRIEQIASNPVQDFLFANEQYDETKWLLRGHTEAGVPAAELAEQVIGRRKAKAKLPTFYQTRGIVYPPRLNLEQTSSEATAQHKVELLRQLMGGHAKAGADLCGGWGVDTFFLSALCEQFYYFDPNEGLVELARHNHRQLGRVNIQYRNQPLPESLTELPDSLSFVYLDPSRRAEGRKLVELADYQPDIVDLLPQILEKTNCVLLKTSPLLDITKALRLLPNVRAVHVVAHDNECKELLFVCDSAYRGKVKVEAVELKGKDLFSFYPEEEVTANASISEPDTFLYEPGAAILKAGAFKLVAQRFQLKKLHANTHLYTSTELLPEFPGRVFQVTALRPEDIRGQQAHVVTRNFPEPAETLKKKLGLSDGGDWYVVACTGPRARHVLVCTRIR